MLEVVVLSLTTATPLQGADDACEAGGDPADAPAVPAVPGFTFAPGTPEGASLDRPSLSSGDEETEEDSEETDAFEGDEEEREQLDGATEVWLLTNTIRAY